MLSISGAERFVRALQTFFVAVVLVFASTAQAQTISIIGGNFQDQPAAGAMRVQVTSPPAGASIAWHVTAGQGGTLPFALTTTPIDSADTSSLSNWQSFNTANGPNGRVLSACLVPLASSPNDARYCVFFNVVGCAAFANILSGNNQAGVPGQTLPSALRIQVTDNLGARKVGQSVEWRVSPPGATEGTLAGITLTDPAQQIGNSTTDASGTTSATLRLGSRIGTQNVTVQPTGGCVAAATNFAFQVASPPSNNAPTVSITRPGNDIERGVGDTQVITVRANDLDPGDRVTRVRIFARDLQTGQRDELYAASGPTRGADIYEYSWTNLREGVFSITADALDTKGASQTSAPVLLAVKRVVATLKLETPEANRVIVPGTPIRLRVIAEDARGGVAGQTIEWEVSLAAKRASAQTKQSKQAGERKASCVADDSPESGAVVSGADGRAEIAFIPGCSVNDRTLKFRLRDRPEVNDQATLLGPVSTVREIRIPTQLVARAIVAIPGQPISVTVTAVDANGAPVAQIPIAWRFVSNTNVGSLEPTAAATDVNGVAEAKVTLLPTATQVLLEACVVGQSVNCPNFVLKNAQVFIAAPAAAAIGTATTHALGSTRLQMSQLTTRFQQLRSEAGGFSNGVGINANGTRVPVGSAGGSNASSGGSTERDIHTDGTRDGKWGLFTMGDIDISRVDEGGGGRTKLSTKGLTIGVDYRATPNATIGAAIGGMRGKAELSNAGSQKAKGTVGAVFGQWFAPGQIYTNAIANYGRNAYDLRRFGFDSAGIGSSTKSRQTGFQIEGGYNFARDRFSVSPYLRYEHVRVALDAIKEANHPDAISVSASSLRANTVALGLVADARFSGAGGVWIPGLRAEYLREKQKHGSAFAQLVNGTPVVIPVPAAPYDTSYGNVGLTLQWLTGLAGQPISVFLGFDTTFGKSGLSTRRYTAGVKLPL